MKIWPILMILISSMLLSCGAKEESSKTKFRISLGNIVANNLDFAGGLIIMGRSEDGQQSFVMAYRSDLELDLKKGIWEFATIGWLSPTAGIMTGTHKCSFQKLDLRDEIATVSFGMSGEKCLISKTLDGSVLTEKKFFDLSIMQMKKLKINFCLSVESFNACSNPTTPPLSYQIEIPPTLKGLATSIPAGLTSNCFNLSGGSHQSDLSVPLGGISGFIGVKVVSFSAAGCTGTKREFFYGHGFAETRNTTLSAGSYFKSMMSPNNNLAFANNPPIVPMSPLLTNTLPGSPVEGGLYRNDSGSLISTPVSVPAGSYAYFRLGSWYPISSSEINLVNYAGEVAPAFSSPHAYLFIEHEGL